MVTQKIKTQREGSHLVVENYTFEKRGTNKTELMWFCTEYRKIKCNAQVKTNLNREVVSQKGIHQHPPLSDS